MLKCWAILSCMFLIGCASPRQIGGAEGLELVNSASMPVPQAADVSTTLLPNYLGPADLIEVTVAGVEWLTDRELRVDAGGEISFPLVGPVHAAGMTPRELEAALTQRLITNGQMVAPSVSVNVKESPSRVVTIEGQVRRPGIYPVAGRITLLQAVALGQGTDEFTALDDVVVFRTVAGQRYAALYDLELIRRGNYADPDIYPNDIVMVGEERGRRFFKDLIAVVPLLTTPLVIAIDRFVN